MANELVYIVTGANNFNTELEGGDPSIELCQIGKEGGYILNGALRFTSVAVARNATILWASLYLVQNWYAGSGMLKFKTWGIDEDNTGGFSDGNWAGSRNRTDAFDLNEGTVPMVGSVKQITVTSIVQEIVNRSGWSSGNAMGFLMEDQGSDDDTYLYDDMYQDNRSYLAIRTTAEPNFKPTPVTVAAPTFPAPDSWGIKVSKPGANVLTCPESDLFYTSRKKVQRILHEAAAIPASGLVTYTHNLGYQPAFLAYADNGGYKYRLPTAWGLNQGGYVSSNKTQVKIATSGSSVYYYVFIDPLQ